MSHIIDTIVAQATPPGYGGVGIIRISGNKSAEVAKNVLGRLPKARYAQYLSFKDSNHNLLDKGIAIWFPRPHSFTGEDVLELQCHGGPIIINLLLKNILQISTIRIALPGEFLERAFLNKKIDLIQAEAVADLIQASSEEAARAAANSLQGTFSNYINDIIESLINLRVSIEATIDFPDEEIEILSDQKIKNKLNKIIDKLENIKIKANQGSILREGIKLVIAGRPNAGKSSLFNLLTGVEGAIVTDIAGTTRDVLHEHINIDGIPLHIIDTAGLRESTNNNIVEQIGIERAWKEIQHADHILFLVDGTSTDSVDIATICPDLLTYFPKKICVTLIRNKADITKEPCCLRKIHNYSLISLSARTGEGINILIQHLKEQIGLFNNNVESSNFLARQRHLQALKLALNYLKKANSKFSQMTKEKELLADELRLAQLALDEIIGKFTSHDLLEKIFSSFCIGK